MKYLPLLFIVSLLAACGKTPPAETAHYVPTAGEQNNPYGLKADAK
jgi:hypothetical protein